MTDEEWLPVSGYEGLYSVSSRARVRTEGTGRGRTLGRILKASPAVNGYRVVTLWKSNSSKQFYVHRLVCRAFNGEAPEGQDHVLHGDGDPLNNLPENVRWGTAAENVWDSISHGTLRNGQADKTHCVHNHPFDDENTYWYKGTRSCITCMRQRTRDWREQNKKVGND